LKRNALTEVVPHRCPRPKNLPGLGGVDEIGQCMHCTEMGELLPKVKKIDSLHDPDESLENVQPLTAVGIGRQ
jgi:hypothetical protein